jgi:hypothetical protein
MVKAPEDLVREFCSLSECSPYRPAAVRELQQPSRQHPAMHKCAPSVIINVRKRSRVFFRLRRGVRSLNDVTFAINRGEYVGLIVMGNVTKT